MTASITHKKVNTIPNWTQADIDKQIALGNLPTGTTTDNITLALDWNDTHNVSGLILSLNSLSGDVNLTSTGNTVTITEVGNNINLEGAITTPYSETPSGTVNGTNRVFTLANTPASGSGVQVFLDGILQYNGIDYTVALATITFVAAPVSGSSIFAFYNTSSATVAGITSVTNTDNTIAANNISNAVIVSLNRTPIGVAYATTVTPAASGAFTLQRIIATGNLTIAVPTGGADGNEIELWITSSGGSFTLTLNASIKVPSSSSFTSPQTLVSSSKSKVLLQYDATRTVWELTSYIPGY